MLDLLVSVSKDATYSCGSLNDVPGMIPYVTSKLYLIIEIAVPVLLILYGMFDLGKAVIAQKEDEIKKGQATFFKRLIAAILVFFVTFIVNLVVNFVATDNTSIPNCINCFIRGNVDTNSCVGGAGSSNTGFKS